MSLAETLKDAALAGAVRASERDVACTFGVDRADEQVVVQLMLLVVKRRCQACQAQFLSRSEVVSL